LDFDALVEPIDLTHLGHTSAMTFHRWDESDLQAFSGTYGDYLLKKVSQVFPQLRDDVL
jgi:polar amino acid transport system ATP-binding protein